MTINITSVTNVKELAVFLEEMNQNLKSHVGFCGEDRNEIHDTLLNDFSDVDLRNSFAVAYQGNKIVGALGLDVDGENQSAEVWGPFVKDKTNPSLAEELWKQAISLADIKINSFSFFLNKENEYGKQFVLKHHGIKKGLYLVLTASREEVESVEINLLEKYSPSYEESFAHLHQHNFPGTYYHAQEIINRINEDNQLLLVTDGHKNIKGYVYVEAHPEHHEGDIEYIAVSDDYRRQGVGTALIKAALNHLFSYEEIDEIALCVEQENNQAIHLYKAAGFKQKYELVSYECS